MALAKIPDFGPTVRRPASRRPGAGVWGPQGPRICFCFEGPISLQDECCMDMRSRRPDEYSTVQYLYSYSVLQRSPKSSSLLLPSIKQPRTYSGSSPVCCLLPPPIKQPRTAGGPPFAASSLPPSSSPAQRELPRLLPPPSPHQAAPRSGSSPIICLVPP